MVGSGSLSGASEGPLGAVVSWVSILVGCLDVREDPTELDSRSMVGGDRVSSFELSDDVKSFFSCERRGEGNHVRPSC